MRLQGLLLTAFLSTVSAQNVVQLPDSLRDAADTVVWVKKVPMYCEGPAWEPATGAVYFTEQFAASVANWPLWKVLPGSTTDTGSVFVNTYQNNGLDFDPQGRLVSCQNGRISRYKSDGTLDSTLVLYSTAGVSAFTQSTQVNDLSIGANGAMYFTSLGSQVFYLNPSRQLSVAATGLTQANGIEWFEEENNVYVNETGGNRVRRLPITSPGVLGTPVNFISSPGPDGGTYDSHGNRYVASYTQGEVRVFNARGDSIGRIALRTATGSYDNRAGNQGNVDNCVFGGSDMKTLFITGDGGLYSIRLKVAGKVRYATPILRYSLRPRNTREADLLRDVRGRWLENPSARIPALRILPLHKK